MKKIVFLSLALMLNMIVTAQEKFTEGKITMTQTMSTDNAEMEAMLKQMMGEKPMESVAYIKGNKSRTEISNQMSGNIVTISDMDKKQMLLLMDSPMLGKKFTLTNLSKEEEEKLKETITIVEGTETKTILGYNCKQHTVTVNKDGVLMEMEMYITDKIAPIMSQQTSILGDQLKGFPMYMVMTMDQQGVDMKIITEVTKLDKELVSDDKFSFNSTRGLH